jgi:autotransporter-associated beta strand protein
MKPKFVRLAFAVAMPLASAAYTQAQTYKNSTADGLSWGTAANWTPATVPNAVDAEAILNGAGPSGTAPATLALDVLLDGNYTIGKFTRNTTGSQAATFSTTPTGSDVTKGLTLQKTTGTPEINVLGDVFWYSAIFGTQGFEKTNAGRFTFRFNTIDQTYTGPIKISGGTLGIEKDRSLGDVNNDIEITPSATVDSILFAEPGNNTDAVTLPASRTITLNDANNFDLFDPCLSSTAAAVVFTIDGDISEVASSGSFLKKVGAGPVVLNGNNSWTGGTFVNTGVLTATKPAALPSYESQYCKVVGTSTLAVRYGDAWTWTDAQIGSLLGNSNLIFDPDAAFGLDTTGNALDTTFALNPVSDYNVSRFTKLGSGKLALTNAPGLTRINVFEGTLALGVASVPAPSVTLTFTKSGSILNLGTTTANATALTHVNGGNTTISNGTLTLPATYSFAPTLANTVLSLPTTTATFGRVQPFGNNTTTINGAGGSLTVNGDFNFDVNGSNNTRLVMSGLGSFTYDRSTRAFRCLPVTAAADTTVHELVLAGTNLVKASLVQVGGASGTSQGNAHQGQMRLGTTNDFRTPTFQVGAFNASGVVNFQGGLTNPSFKLRGADGASAASTLTVGETSSGVRSGAGTLDLSAGSADILATGILIGRHIASASNGANSTLTVNAGSIKANHMILTEKVGGSTPALIGVVNQRGNATTVELDSLTLSQAGFGALATGQALQANYNLDGGTLTVGNINAFCQVETASATGSLTTAGSLAVTVTSTDLGAPVVVNVPVVVGNKPTGNDGSDWTLKVATALNANATIAAKFIASRSDNAVIITRRGGGLVDSTLNIALANGTAAGITPVTTSTDAVVSRNTSTGITRNLILKGGTLINKAGANLDISGVTVTVAGVTTTVVDSTPAQAVNFTDVAFSTRINSATPSAGTLQVDGDVVLTSSTLAVVDDATTNAVAVAPGTKLVLIDYQDGSLTGTFTNIADGGTVNVTKGTVTNAFVLDYNDPAYGGKAVTLTIPGVNNYASWATDNSISGQSFSSDYDSDGIINGVEYALGTDPKVSTQPAGVLAGNTLTFTKGSAAITNADVSWTIETSETLEAGSWMSAVTQAAGNASASIAYSFTPGTPVKKFARLKVVQAP